MIGLAYMKLAACRTSQRHCVICGGMLVVPLGARRERYSGD